MIYLIYFFYINKKLEDKNNYEQNYRNKLYTIVRFFSNYFSTAIKYAIMHFFPLIE